jgi:hypothetical protein
MSTIEDGGNDQTGTPSGKSVDMKLEVVVIPVSDVGRAKTFLHQTWREARRRPHRR